MNTKNIFRTLLVAIALVMGASNIQAEVIWEGNVVGGKCPSWHSGTDGAIDLPANLFTEQNSAEGTVMTIHATLSDDGSDGYWKFYIANLWYGSLNFADYHGDSNGNLYENASPNNYDASKGCFTLTFSSSTLGLIQNGSNGVMIRFLGLTITKIELGTGGSTTPTTPTEPTLYTLTYTVDGEPYGEAESYEAGATITPKAAPTKEGYTFSGWSNLPTTMPANNVTVTGTFTKNQEMVTATISSSTGYATFCSSKALNFAGVTGLKAYYASAVSDTEIYFTQIMGTVAAGTGMLLYGTTSQIPVVEDGSNYSANMMIGVLGSDTDIWGENIYVLVEKEGVATFTSTANYPATVRSGKAYLQTAYGSRQLTFRFSDGTTAIGTAAATAKANDVYDLQGRRVAAPTKGLYIVNGKKVIVK